MQEALRGELLDFSGLSLPEPERYPKFDQVKLKDLRYQLHTQIQRHELRSEGLNIPFFDLEGEKTWYEDERPLNL